jgi:DNA-binding MarR family transcriptional regulator
MSPRASANAQVYRLDDPVLEFLRLLWSIQHGLQRVSKRMEKRFGVTGPQRLVLRIVGRYPGISAGDLAHILRLHPSTLTGILQRLVTRGLLAREADPADNRRARLRVKGLGRSFTRYTPGTVEASVRAAFRRASSPKVRGAREVLTAIAQGLDVL